MSFSVPSRKSLFNFPFKIGNRLILRVHFLRFIILLCVFIGSFYGSHAQDEEPRRRGSRVLDDTTKQVYGPKTSKFYYENDVFMNRITLHPIDTTIRNFHLFNYVQWH